MNAVVTFLANPANVALALGAVGGVLGLADAIAKATPNKRDDTIMGTVMWVFNRVGAFLSLKANNISPAPRQ